MKVDMHVHTLKSSCSLNPIRLLKKLCSKMGILPFICDHNTLTKTDFGIPGEEISTDRGEFIGLFLNEAVNDRDIFEAMDKVKEQGGLIYLPHPFDENRGRSLCRYNILNDREFKKRVDIVEVFNSRCRDNRPNEMAYQYAKMNNMLMGVGSDSHFPWELGNAYLILEEEFDRDNPKDFLRVLKKNNKSGFKYYGKLGSPINMICSKISKKINNSGSLRLPKLKFNKDMIRYL
ncbi:MAG TPA: PHP domain-containing protein [Methanothermococcus okinawensis]|uniref:PHP domain-containing protein n=1 Tax=Methanothermococcus okinawensis TaxID=155863 RepID=A0A833EAP1_9EURY|nr:PHP domain-containing protein [Methanothermococcus okinawensis]